MIKAEGFANETAALAQKLMALQELVTGLQDTKENKLAIQTITIALAKKAHGISVQLAQSAERIV